MKNRKRTKNLMPVYFRVSAAAMLCLSFAVGGSAAAQTIAYEDRRGRNLPTDSAPGSVIVLPKFGGQILGYAVDPTGTEGLLSEFVDLANGNVLAATETFDQSTGQILNVVAKTQTQDDFVTQGVFGQIGLVLYQHDGRNFFLKMNPLDLHKFNGVWNPPIMPQYQLWTMSADQGTPNVAAYQSSFETGLTYVFSSNIATNTFGPQISLQSIIDGSEFFHPAIALDSRTNQAVLADSLGCPEQVCVMSIALVNLTTGDISEFTNNLGIGDVDGLAVDSVTGIACTTTLIDQGVEFYDLAKQTGFEVQIPNAGNATQAGLDVEFDPIHSVFLVAQYSSTGDPNNPQPRIYVYDEQGNVKETVSGLQRIPISPLRIALNPVKRMGFVPVIVEPQNQFLELQSFSY